MTHAQKQVVVGMSLAVAVTLIALFGAYYLSRMGVDPVRLSAPAASALAALALVYCIAGIARKRFFQAETIGGAAYDAPGNDIGVDKAILQNTLEQVVLAVAAYNGLAAVAPGLAPVLLPALVILFLLGRLLFVRGYRKGAGHRALGFGLTFYPTVAAYVLFVAILFFQM